MSDNSDNSKIHDNESDRLFGKSPSLSANTPKTIVLQGNTVPSDNLDNYFGQSIIGYASGGAKTDMSSSLPYKLPRLHQGGADRSKWYVEFYYDSPEGKPTRFKKTEGFTECRTPEELKARGEALILIYEDKLKNKWSPFNENKRLQNHLQYKNNRTDTVEYCLNLFAHAKKRDMRDKSFTTYLTKLRMLMSWLNKGGLDRMLISAFTKEHARRFLDDLRAGTVTKNKISNRTYNSYLQTLETAWNWLEKYNENLVEKNPWNTFPSLYAPAKRKAIYTEQQREIIFRFLYENNKQLWMISRLIYQTFLRPGREITGLQASDIDFHDNKIWIEADISKNKKTQSVPLPPEVRKMLLENKLQQMPGAYYIFGLKGPTEEPVGRDYWSKLFSKIAATLGMPKGLTLYTFKHTGNQVAHRNGMPIKEQMELNRHHSLDQMDTYLRSIEPSNAEDLKKYFRD